MSKCHRVQTNLATFCSKQRNLEETEEFYEGVSVSSTMTIDPVEMFSDSSINDTDSITVDLTSDTISAPTSSVTKSSTVSVK